MSLEIRPLAALYPPPHTKKYALQGCALEFSSRSQLSVVARGGMIMPTAFAPLSIVSV